jgi:uncharacterized protein
MDSQPAPGGDDSPLVEVRSSSIHGRGVFALQRIGKGTRIAEYVGERLTGAEVERRYADETDTGHTFLFHVSDDVYVDASNQGNDARFINHSCEPNCESEVEHDRVYICALQDIEPGEELTYDYALEPEDDPPSTWMTLYACRCGAARCRGTLIEPGSEPRPLV